MTGTINATIGSFMPLKDGSWIVDTEVPFVFPHKKRFESRFYIVSPGGDMKVFTLSQLRKVKTSTGLTSLLSVNLVEKTNGRGAALVLSMVNDKTRYEYVWEENPENKRSVKHDDFTEPPYDIYQSGENVIFSRNQLYTLELEISQEDMIAARFIPSNTRKVLKELKRGIQPYHNSSRGMRQIILINLITANHRVFKSPFKVVKFCMSLAGDTALVVGRNKFFILDFDTGE